MAETQTQPPPPSFTVFNRISSIPIVSSSLSSIRDTLNSYTLTRAPYQTAQSISNRLIDASTPLLQAHLVAPVISRADGYANKAVDVVERRYPNVMTTTPNDIYVRIRKDSEHAVSVANRTIDERVKSPAYGLAKGVDQKFTPVVDGFEYVVNKIHSHTSTSNPPSPRSYPSSIPSSSASSDSGASTSTETQAYQYQRAYRLSLDLKDQLYVYTGEHIRQVQEHNVVVQRATETAYNLSQMLSTSASKILTDLNSVSDRMINELHHVQTSLNSISSSARGKINSNVTVVRDNVGETISTLREILKDNEAGYGEKAKRIKEAIEGKVKPVLESAVDAVGGVLKRGGQQNGEKKQNGHAATANGDDRSYAAVVKEESQ